MEVSIDSNFTKDSCSVDQEASKVYIRIRPKLRNEFLKETVVYTEPDVN